LCFFVLVDTDTIRDMVDMGIARAGYQKGETAFEVDFVGVGARKAGTTWIADCLWEHPQICMSQPKEVNYFNESLTNLLEMPNKNFGKPLDWYMQHYAHCKKGTVRGEYCISYLKDPNAAKVIHSFFPATKIIIGLRDPVDRAYSDYNMFHHYVYRDDSPTFEEAIRKNENYLKASLYAEDLERYLGIFGRNRVHCILLDDIKKDPKSIVARLYAFLDVDSSFQPKTLWSRANESKVARFRYFGRVVFHSKRFMVRLRLNGLLEFLKRSGLDQSLLKIGAKEQAFGKVDPKTRKDLIPYFVGDIEKVESLLERDLSAWKQ
jgi:hypothetical protein